MPRRQQHPLPSRPLIIISASSIAGGVIEKEMIVGFRCPTIIHDFRIQLLILAKLVAANMLIFSLDVEVLLTSSLFFQFVHVVIVFVGSGSFLSPINKTGPQMMGASRRCDDAAATAPNLAGEGKTARARIRG
jgi:hypothetical protein